jgi:phosphatidylinositol glycan class M
MVKTSFSHKQKSQTTTKNSSKKKKFFLMTTKTTNPTHVTIIFGLAFILRLLIVLYSTWHDRHFLVKYTDIDYVVFTDASRFVLQGKSPYMRATYRYTPLLSYLLLPNIFLYENFGKILFCLSDLCVAVLVFHFLRKMHSFKSIDARDERFNLILTCAAVLFNPITINTSTRGNADQIVVLLSLLCIGAVIYDKDPKIAGILFGLSVHFKIYPVIYGPLILIYYTYAHRLMSEEKENSSVRRLSHIIFDRRVVFCISGGSTLLVLTGIFYLIYGYTFLYESYLYHIVRSDHRHNFSVYFYQMYLNSAPNNQSTNLFYKSLAILAFLPQITLLCLFYVIYIWICRSERETKSNLQISQLLLVNMFIVTFIFVVFNKVCTVQYFIWYMTPLAFVLQRIRDINSMHFTKKHIYIGVALASAWIISQALWLSQGYKLEFLGQQVFLHIWIASLIFFSINIAILCAVATSALQKIPNL